MAYIPTIVIDDDNEEVLKIFRLKSAANGVKVVTFNSWDRTKEYLESGNLADALVLDARGKLSADENEKDAHIITALRWVDKFNLPYVIYTAFTDEMDFLSEEIEMGKVFTKG
ncbi:MAG: hypothetical protein R6V23_01380, partial [Bacteroidales bacterium]